MKNYRLAIGVFAVGLLVLYVIFQPDDDPKTGESVTITVSAAADLTPAFREIGLSFEAETGVHVIFNFGSTGQLTEQIRQGADVDLFAAANIAYIDQLEEEGFIIPETKALYAQGRITLWTRQDSALQIEQLEDLVKPSVERIAIANPEHAPYGLAAQEALKSAGVWDTVSSKLLLGENVAQTLSIAQTGEADVAIIALSLSIASDGRWALIPAELHNPLNQALAVIRGADHEAEAREFAAFVNSPQGRSVMRRYGFILPGEEPIASQ